MFHARSARTRTHRAHRVRALRTQIIRARVSAPDAAPTYAYQVVGVPMCQAFARVFSAGAAGIIVPTAISPFVRWRTRIDKCVPPEIRRWAIQHGHKRPFYGLICFVVCMFHKIIAHGLTRKLNRAARDHRQQSPASCVSARARGTLAITINCPAGGRRPAHSQIVAIQKAANRTAIDIMSAALSSVTATRHACAFECERHPRTGRPMASRPAQIGGLINPHRCT